MPVLRAVTVDQRHPNPHKAKSEPVRSPGTIFAGYRTEDV
jgi:hypothetical protein